MEPDTGKEADKDNKQTAQKENKEQGTKIYLQSKKKWRDFKIEQGIIQSLVNQNKQKPTKVQEETLNIALNPDRKKFNLLVRAINGSGKTLAFLIPIINSLEPGLKTAQDKNFRGKLLQNQIFKPQGIIFVQNILLQSQLDNYLQAFQKDGQINNIQKLKFTFGKLNTDGHKHGDILISMPKSFLNRWARKNMDLSQCKFVAIDQIDDIFHYDKQSLTKILEIVHNERPSLISCSATMEKKFKDFYGSIDKDYIALDLNKQLGKETGQIVTLEGVKNFYHKINYTEGKVQIFQYILKTVFKQLYKHTDKNKPQVFVFFNSATEIFQFTKRFDALASDFTSDESQYLKDISKATLSAKVFKDNNKVDMSVTEKQQVLKKFRNNQTNILLCTNIMARGIDIRNAVFVINVGAPKISDKSDDIDVDIYLHRVGRTGRHTDKGVALTLSNENQIKNLCQRVNKVHKIDVLEMKDMNQITDQVHACIQFNA